MSDLQDLLDVATGKIPHTYIAHCPSPETSTTARDRRCIACRIISRAEAAFPPRVSPEQWQSLIEAAELLGHSRGSREAREKYFNLGEEEEFIRFDFTHADGRPDCKMVTHDEFRQRYADLLKSNQELGQDNVQD